MCATFEKVKNHCEIEMMLECEIITFLIGPRFGFVCPTMSLSSRWHKVVKHHEGVSRVRPTLTLVTISQYRGLGGIMEIQDAQKIIIQGGPAIQTTVS